MLKQEGKTLFLTEYKQSDGTKQQGLGSEIEGRTARYVKPTVVLRTAFVTIHKYTGNDKCGAETAILGINTADDAQLTRKARPLCRANQAVA